MDEDGPNVLWELQPCPESDSGFHCGASIELLSQFASEQVHPTLTFTLRLTLGLRSPQPLPDCAPLSTRTLTLHEVGDVIPSEYATEGRTAQDAAWLSRGGNWRWRWWWLWR